MKKNLTYFIGAESAIILLSSLLTFSTVSYNFWVNFLVLNMCFIVVLAGLNIDNIIEFTYIYKDEIFALTLGVITTEGILIFICRILQEYGYPRNMLFSVFIVSNITVLLMIVTIKSYKYLKNRFFSEPLKKNEESESDTSRSAQDLNRANLFGLTDRLGRETNREVVSSLSVTPSGVTVQPGAPISSSAYSHINSLAQQMYRAEQLQSYVGTQTSNPFLDSVTCKECGKRLEYNLLSTNPGGRHLEVQPCTCKSSSEPAEEVIEIKKDLDYILW